MKVSIIIPVFNNEENIEECLETLINQTYQNLEIIIINDNSTDKSREAIRTYENQDSRIKIIDHEINKGVAAARNLGVETATGEFLFFLDADDLLAPYTIAVLMDNINNEANLVMGSVNKTEILIPEKITENIIEVKTLKSKNKQFGKRARTVAGVLFRTEFVNRLNLRFDESVKHHTDLTFMIPALVEESNIQLIKSPSMYIRGTCYDPINNPSLHLQDDTRKIDDYLYLYEKLIHKYSGYKNISLYLDKRLLALYYKQITDRVLDEDYKLNNWFDQLSECLKYTCPKTIKKSGSLAKKEIDAILNKNLNLTIKRMSSRRFVNKLKRALKSRHNLYKELYHSFFSKLPIKKKRVVFESFGGKSYSGNPRYIYEQLQTTDNYQAIWILNDLTKEIPGSPIKVKRFSFKYYYYLATAKYWVINARMPNFLKKREGTTYLQTWHGTPLKKLATDMKEVQMPGTTTEKYKLNFYKESQTWDYLISPNSYSTEIFRRAFVFDSEFLEFGYPRNDILYLQKEIREQKRKDILTKVGIPLEKKVVLYAPTWRDDEFYGKGKYKFNIKLDLEKMQKRLGDEYVVALRMHYLIAENLDTSEFNGFAYDLSNYEDIAELYLASDILITDYSSVFFDYANLKRPILFFTYDIEKYRDSLRGFYMNFEEEAPGPLLQTSDEVIDAIANIDDVSAHYKQKFDDFYEKYCSFDDGQASKNVIDKVFNP